MPELPSEELFNAILKRANESAPEDKQLQQNFLFAGLFARDGGYYSEKGQRLSRRKWIETYFYILDKKERLVPLVLNGAQRRTEYWILTMERAGIPVRIIALKARQVGWSTFVQSVMFETILRGQNRRGLIVADTKDRSEMLLRIATTARTRMPLGENPDDTWDFKMNSKAKYAMKWSHPINGAIDITSSEVDRPGMGGTRTVVHLSESAHFVEPELKYPSILASLPAEVGTYGFDESTANGDSGLFRDNWMSGYAERDVPLRARKFRWVSLFFAWWENEHYFYSRTYGGGQEPSAEQVAEIQASLDDEEKWLLTQRYWVRGRPGMEWEEVACADDRTGEPTTKWRLKGVGWRHVGYDQLAWRRMKIADPEIHGDLNLFNQEYPSRYDVAFLSTGNRVFSPDVLSKYSRKVVDPIWTGTLEEPVVEPAPA